MIVVTAAVRVVGGDPEALAERYRGRGRLAEATPGCLGVEVLRSLERPEEFLVVSRWADEAAYAAYRRSPAFRAAHAAIAGLPGLKVDPAARAVVRYEVLA